MTRSISIPGGGSEDTFGREPPWPTFYTVAGTIYDFGTCPPLAPPSIVKNTIFVRDPDKIYVLKNDQRRRAFFTLVERYTQQVLHGCQNPKCTNSSCFTFRQRASHAPARKYKDVSARTLAVHLATQDDPEKALCPQGNLASSGKPSLKHKKKGRSNRKDRGSSVSGGSLSDCGLARTKSVKSPQSSSIRIGLHSIVRVNDTDAKTKADSASNSHGWLEPGPLDEKDNKPGKKRKRWTIDFGSLIQNLIASGPVTTLILLPCVPLQTVANFAPGNDTDFEYSDRLDMYRLEMYLPITYDDREVDDDRNPYKLPSSALPDVRRYLPQAAIRERISSRVKLLKYLPKQTDGHTEYVRPPPQTVSHLSYDLVKSLLWMDKEAEHRYLTYEECMLQSFGLDPQVELDKGVDYRYNVTKTFINQSIYYALSNTDSLIQSFRCAGCTASIDDKNPLRNIDDSARLENSFRSLIEFDKSLVLHSLWHGLEALFVPPPELMSPRSPILKASLSTGAPSVTTSLPNSAGAKSVARKLAHIHDAEAAYIVAISLHALAAAVPKTGFGEERGIVRQVQAQGQFLPVLDCPQGFGQGIRNILDCTDGFEHELALRLMKRLVRAVHARGCFTYISKARNGDEIDPISSAQPKPSFIGVIVQQLVDSQRCHDDTTTHKPDSLDPDWALPAVTLDWTKRVMLKEWDGKAEVRRASTVGSAVEVLSNLYDIHDQIGLSPDLFEMPILSERLDPIEMPVEWVASISNIKTVHLLSRPFLFTPAALLGYFRALNHANMAKAFDTSITSARLVTQMVFADPFLDDSENRAFNRLKLAVDLFLLLKIRRSNVLGDALDQLWRREKRELTRPLKVQMGVDEGEEGLDIGGVQQEFFRAAIGEALNPDYGVFTTDTVTQMSWFQICSLEPLYKFELLGLIVSLAVYNGNTIPLNFPIALYRKLLGFQVTEIHHIQDGWPDKAKAFTELLMWSGQEDVKDIFMFNYEFSFNYYGNEINVNMKENEHKNDWTSIFMTTGSTQLPSSVPSRSIPAPPFRFRHQRGSERGCREAASGKKRKGKGKASAAMRPETNGRLSPRESDLESAKPSAGSNDNKGWSKHDPSPNEASNMGEVGKENGGAVPPDGFEAIECSEHEGDEAEAASVTNANREQWIKDYIYWLTDKSIRPQYEAFARGFFVCLDKTALSLFKPESLQTVVEGVREVDINGLERVARYEDPYNANHHLVKNFWSIVRAYPLEQKRRLLEFVTASDRVPASGVGRITLVIMRSGPDSDRLPSSTTCFGRLLLPEYSSRSKLKEKLDLALEHTIGFGNI